MAPKLDTEVLGRHGAIGVDVLSHDLPLEVGLPIDSEYARMVDEMDARVAERLRAERQAAVGQRTAEISLADTIQLQAS